MNDGAVEGDVPVEIVETERANGADDGGRVLEDGGEAGDAGLSDGFKDDLGVLQTDLGAGAVDAVGNLYAVGGARDGGFVGDFFAGETRVVVGGVGLFFGLGGDGVDGFFRWCFDGGFFGGFVQKEEVGSETAANQNEGDNGEGDDESFFGLFFFGGFFGELEVFDAGFGHFFGELFRTILHMLIIAYLLRKTRQK